MYLLFILGLELESVYINDNLDGSAPVTEDNLINDLKFGNLQE